MFWDGALLLCLNSWAEVTPLHQTQVPGITGIANSPGLVASLFLMQERKSSLLIKFHSLRPPAFLLLSCGTSSHTVMSVEMNSCHGDAIATQSLDSVPQIGAEQGKDGFLLVLGFNEAHHVLWSSIVLCIGAAQTTTYICICSQTKSRCYFKNYTFKTLLQCGQTSP